MNVIQQRKVVEEDLNLFDESDWDFLNVPEGSKNFQFFEDIPDTSFAIEEHGKLRLVLFTILSSILGIFISFLLITCYQIYVVPLLGLSTNEEYERATQEIDNSKMEHVVGRQVDSDTLIEISGVINDYFSTINNGADYQRLNSLCLVSSNFANVEKKYRKSAVSSYDTDDCYARALREFSRYISLDYVDEIIYKDGSYYCYIVLNIPDSDEFFEYFMSYKYEMTKFFSTKSLDYINITRFLLSLTSSNDIPLKSREFLFKVSYVDGKYLINDDTQITNICTDAYNSSISNIVQILGGVLVKTQYE